MSLAAHKWDAAAFLLEALGDAEAAVRSKASQLLDSWIADFNRSQVQPSSQQPHRIRELLDARASEISEETAGQLRFSLKTH